VEGTAQPWHWMHVGSLAVSRAGLVILEGTAVEAAGRMTPEAWPGYRHARGDAAPAP
jgi:2,4-dienoyl-CoA reductase-like NADH-dependent reductase (Old Yellow Enzyme family)